MVVGLALMGGDRGDIYAYAEEAGPGFCRNRAMISKMKGADSLANL